MPYMTNGRRDYKKELNWEKSSKPGRVKDRAKRNAARKMSGLSVGDSRQVDHKKPLSSGGTNSKKNLRVVSAKINLKKEAMRKKRNG
jgi:5-methylcytosine-specific restriction endonuclease McrA